MPINHKVHPDQRRVTTTVTGLLTLDSLRTEQANFWINPELIGYSELFDLRQAEVDDLFHTDVIKYAGEAAAHTETAKIALLVDNERQRAAAQTYVTARRFKSNYRPCQIFDQLDQALNWLDFDDGRRSAK
jgi:hypothetical protein